jgi:hypothetical protein
MKIGSIIGLGFGLLWWVAGAGAVSGSTGTIFLILGVLIFLTTGIYIMSRRIMPQRRKPR